MVHESYHFWGNTNIITGRRSRTKEYEMQSFEILRQHKYFFLGERVFNKISIILSPNLHHFLRDCDLPSEKHVSKRSSPGKKNIIMVIFFLPSSTHLPIHPHTPCPLQSQTCPVFLILLPCPRK